LTVLGTVQGDKTSRWVVPQDLYGR